MGKKLEIELYRYNALVFGKVINQCKSITNSRDEDWERDIIEEIKDFKIRSAGNPQLMNNSLYIRGGNRESDDKVFSHIYRNEEEAVKAVKSIEELVYKINSKETEERTKIIKVM